MDRGAWQATVHAVAESEITEYARVHACGHTRTRAHARARAHTHTHTDTVLLLKFLIIQGI